jgi:Raf kinase inhibitor-like YbhB/YbcL family protein
MLRSRYLWYLILPALLGCAGEKPGDSVIDQGVPSMKVTSSAFGAGAAIPKQYTGDGRDISPPLAWSDVPEGAKTFALICDDPDAPRKQPWVHWVLFNLPAGQRELPEGVPAEGTLSSGARQGKNDFGKLGYGGPAPPPGKPHRYFFKVYALDTSIDLPVGAAKGELEQAMRGHVRAEGQVMGTYSR